MWILILLFGLATAILGWTIFAYFLMLWLVGLFRRSVAPPFPAEWPRLSLVIPFYNERTMLPGKLADTREVDYPRDRLETVFVDGGSTDGSAEWIREAVRGDPQSRVLSSPRPGKIHQLNHALPWLSGDIVVSTDADARLAPDALRWIAAEMASSSEVAVVGAYCQPAPGAYHIDRYYWDAQNKARLVESQAANASIVVAPCYAYRRDLFPAFPDDVVADDLYVAFLASALGRRTVYSRHARVTELRNPRHLGEFLPHKFRKANAFLRESLRFVYRIPDMAPLVRLVFVTRIAQQLLFPWTLGWWLGLGGALVTLDPLPRHDVVVMGGALLLLLFLLVSRAYRTVELPGHKTDHSLNTMVRGWILTTLVLLVTGISYAFYRQDSGYARLGGGPVRPPGTAGLGVSDPPTGVAASRR
jgi:cellulose synthase/poly-beta-1,6-N-acetylglucosamine synthase-like glycosyltransferase